MSTISVLLVEDNMGDARLVEIMLREASLECKCDISFEFLMARTLSEAFDIADKQRPNIILLDLGLPDSSGVDTIKKVIEKIPGIPVIAHTGMDDIRTGMEATRLGAIGYMVKGESTPSLLAKNILFALEQYKLKNELEKKELFLSTLIESAPIPIFYKDINGIYRGCNRLLLDMYGYKRDEIIGKTVYDIAPKMAAEQDEQKDKDVLDNPSAPLVYEATVQDRYRTKEYEVVFHKSAFFDADNKIAGVIGTIIDVTEKKRADKEYKKQEEMLIMQSRQAAMGEMIGMIAHQWRQPITAIGMAINNLRVDMELDMFSRETTSVVLSDVEELISHLSKTIDDFRDFFKIEREKDMVSVDDVVGDTLHIIGKSLESSKVTLQTNLGASTKIKIFRREMVQVFLNIIKNAKDALQDNAIQNPSISIETKELNGEILVSICDNGIGISDEVSKHLFEPYFTTKGPTSGTGLGLYMSNVIVTRHHYGKIEVEKLPRGVCFIVRLPIYMAEDVYI